jgi:hypothetical protein
MIPRVVLGSLLLTGCFTPSYDYADGQLTCSESNLCPDGFHCAQEACWHDGTEPPPPVTITVTTYQGSTAGALPFVAYQDGDKPWQAVTTAGSTYQFQVIKGRYGVAWGCTNETDFFYATTAEKTSLNAGCKGPVPSMHKISGNLAGLAATDQAYVFFGLGSQSGPPLMGTSTLTWDITTADGT